MTKDSYTMTYAELYAEHDRLCIELLSDLTNEELKARATAIFTLIMRTEDR